MKHFKQRAARRLDGIQRYMSPLLLFLFCIIFLVVATSNAAVFLSLNFWGFKIAASGLFFPVFFLIITAISFSYGYAVGQAITLAVLVFQILFWFVMAIFCHFADSHSATTVMFDTLYDRSLLMSFSQSFALLCALSVNGILTSLTKRELYVRYLVTRTIIINAISKAVLVMIAYPFAFYGRPWSSIIELMIDTWVLKIGMAIVLIVLFLNKIIYLIHSVDKVDIIDRRVRYRVFSVFRQDMVGDNVYSDNQKS